MVPDSEPASSPLFQKVLIVGAGPAGLLLALLLGRKSTIQVTVLEAWDRLDERLRATQYGSPASRVFREAGVLDDIRAEMITTFQSICWRSVADDGHRITGVDLNLTRDEPDRLTVLPLNRVVQILYARVRSCKNVEVLFEHRVKAVGQDGEAAWVDVELGPEAEEQTRKEERFYADYVVGCDGSTSKVRHELFGRNWPGTTWPYTLLVQNVFYTGFSTHAWSGGNYLISPIHWGLAAERGKGGLWRVTYADVPDLTLDEYIRRRDAHFEAMLPGHPRPDEYEVTQTDQFNIHNRCVESMRVGRVLLAADAAHVCNPFGGYGAMTAILDVGGLADCLVGLHTHKCDDSVLDLYSQIRREKFLQFVDKRSVKNMYRLHSLDPDRALQDDKFLALLAEMEGDEGRVKAFLLKESSIEYDFKQHYTY